MRHASLQSFLFSPCADAHRLNNMISGSDMLVPFVSASDLCPPPGRPSAGASVVVDCFALQVALCQPHPVPPRGMYGLPLPPHSASAVSAAHAHVPSCRRPVSKLSVVAPLRRNGPDCSRPAQSASAAGTHRLKLSKPHVNPLCLKMSGQIRLRFLALSLPKVSQVRNPLINAGHSPPQVRALHLPTLSLSPPQHLALCLLQ